MLYLQFIQRGLSGQLKEMLGSDGIGYIDNRLSLDNMIVMAIEMNRGKINKADGVRIVKKQNDRIVNSDLLQQNVIKQVLF